jgi:hypothetical protein
MMLTYLQVYQHSCELVLLPLYVVSVFKFIWVRRFFWSGEDNQVFFDNFNEMVRDPDSIGQLIILNRRSMMDELNHGEGEE